MIVGRSQKVKILEGIIDHVACIDLPVLIIGEPGTYKEWSARYIHEKSSREGKPFVKVNSSIITKDELFGYPSKGVRGDKRKLGKFELANNGTLFFDRIADLNLDLQAMLLQISEDKEVLSLGGRDLVIDVRILASANQDLESAVLESKFRKDLYYRLSAIRIDLPPLRERKEDIPDLINFFLSKYTTEFDKHIVSLTDKSLEVLIRYDWPGNIRELDNFVKNIVVLGDVDGCIQRIHRQIDLNNSQSKGSYPGTVRSSSQLSSYGLSKAKVRD